MKYRLNTPSFPSPDLESFLQHTLVVKFSQFTDAIESMSQEERCSIQKAFSDRWNPDYSNKIHRAFYLLKYVVPYCVEYREIYRNILQDISTDHNISILSIGCGAMLDLIGFYYANSVNDISPLSRQIHILYTIHNTYYHGIDITDWKTSQEYSLNSNKVIFTCNDIKDITPDGNTKPYNIIIFPKSISDIPLESIENFIRALPGNKLSSRLCLVLSKRGASIDDRHNAEHICRILNEAHHYNISKLKYLLGSKCLGMNFTDLLAKRYFKTIKDLQEIISSYITNIPHKCTSCNQQCSFTKPFMKKIAYEYMDYNTGISRLQINAAPIIYYLQRHGTNHEMA